MFKSTENLSAVVNAVRYEVRTRDFWIAFVAENEITRDQIAETAKGIAVLAYPTDEPVQKSGGTRTRFGNAVQAAAAMLRKVIDTDEDDTPKPVVLRVSLSGEGGGSTVVEPTHPLYNEIVALLAPSGE